MDATQKLLITLLKSAVTEKPFPLPEGYDLQLALNMAHRHQIVAMVYDGAVRCGIDPSLPQMQQMFQIYCRTMQHSEGQMAWVERLFRAFDGAGVDYLPLKGCRLKRLYPKPELRTMGDADVLIRVAQYDTIAPLMAELGFAEDGESDHELKWKTPELNVELHKRLIPSDNKDYFAYYGDGWQLAKVRNGTQYAMTKEDEFVYIFAHFAKHFRGGGAGYRYITDLWVFLRENPEMDQAYIAGELEKLQMDRFYQRILKLIDAWFGEGPMDDTLDLMSQYIYDGGTWGNLESKALSKTLRDSLDSAAGNGGRIVYLRKLLFPSAQNQQYNYPFLKKAPWLLPVAWMMRGFRILFREREKVTVKEKEWKAVDDKAIQEREIFLNQVGLEYNF